MPIKEVTTQTDAERFGKILQAQRAAYLREERPNAARRAI